MKKHGSLNHIYRLIWSHVLKTWVAVAENSKGRGKGKNAGCRLVAAALSLSTLAFTLPPAMAGPALAIASSTLPAGAQVTAGAATISQSGSTLTVKESSERAAINWQTFSIGSNATVNFVQPNSSAVILDRVVGNESSVIAGALNANGQVFLLNSNGVLFTKGASVNAGALVAATLNISDSDFMAGRSTFAAASTHASVVNQGAIHVADGGYVALLGNQVINQGVISARLGTAILAAGDQVSLNFNGNALVNVVVNQGTLDALVSNREAIYADGGLVILTAKAADTVLASVVNNSGEIRAQTIANSAGKIYLLGDMQNGTVDVGGTLDASAPHGGNGGFIDTSAARVSIAGDAILTTSAPHGLTGSWLIDPTDFTISAGSAALTSSGIGATTLQGELGSTGVNIFTTTSGSQNGNINVNAPVSWSANTLSLTAQGNININANMVASGTSQLVLNYGWNGSMGSPTYGANGSSLNVGMNPNGTFMGAVYFADDTSGTNARSGTGFLTINGNGYTVINSVGAQGDATGGAATLQGMAASANLGGYFALGVNVNAAGTATWNSNAGFTPIGSTSASSFTGTFDGLGHTISTLTINLPSTNGAGLFGYGSSTSIIRNVGLVAGSVNGSEYVGGLIGYSSGLVANSYTTSTVVGVSGGSYGGYYVGGLMGYGNAATIVNSHATGAVTGTYVAGGLLGNNLGGAVTDSYATGAVTGGSNTGGLVGSMGSNGTISNSYATGSVTGSTNVGGLAGIGGSGTISNSHATGNVTGSSYVGGLVGYNESGTVSSSYSTGSVAAGISVVGGLVGRNDGTVDSSYATGLVTGVNYGSGTVYATFVGGLAGQNSNIISNSYANGAVNGASDVGGLVGLSWGPISASSATGNVMGSGPKIGGLVGFNNGSSISSSFATGAVAGASYVGGLVGKNTGSVTASNATGNVTGSGNYVGGLVGYNYGGTISTSFATGTVSGASYVGGLTGDNSGSITESHATGAAVGAGNYVGGLIGNNTGTDTGNYATGAVSGANYVGGLVGYLRLGTSINNSYAAGNVTGIDEVGGLVGYNQFSTLSNAFYNADAVTVNGGHELTAGALFGAQYAAWFASNADTNLKTLSIANYSSTLPLVSGSYQVGSVQSLKDMLGFSESNVNDSFLLTANLSLPQGYSVPYFSGSFNGGNYFLSNLSISLPDSMRGMFGFLPNTLTSISNLGVNGTVGGLSYVGGLVGYNYGGGSISNSSFSGTVATGNMTGLNPDFVGGLVGFNNNGSITSSYAKGTLTTGSVAGNSYVGGLVGYNNGSASISNSFAAVNITVGNVSGSDGAYIGGLLGIAESVSTINQSYATGSVTVAGNVSGNYGRNVGGLVGLNLGTIQNSFARGNVSGTGSVSFGSYVGGLVGETEGIINNSYATGIVSSGGPLSGTNLRGALAGSGAGVFSNNFYDNQLNGSMTGLGNSADSAGQVWGMSTADMKNQANFGAVGNGANGGAAPNWDFSTPIWVITPQINAGYPCLAWTGCTPPTVIYLDVSSGSSVYGSTPTYTYGYFTSPIYGDGTAVTNAGAYGTVSWAGSVPTSASGIGSYSMTYASGISLSSNLYSLEAGNPSDWNVVAPPVPVPVIVPPSKPKPTPVPTQATAPDISTTVADAFIEGQPINYVPAGETNASGPVSAGGQPAGFANVVNPPPQINSMFGAGVQLAIISSPTENEPTQVVSLSEARTMLQSAESGGGDGNSPGTSAGTGSPNDVRVPVSRNSLAEIVNGGVRLPTGVEQQLFVVRGQ